MIGFPNRIDDSSISGGSWLAALPLANLKNRTLGRVARSTSLAADATTLTIDLGKSQKIRAIDLRNHNLSTGGKIRFRASNESPATNLCVASEDFGNSTYWSVIRSVVERNAAKAPDGTTTADWLRNNGVADGTVGYTRQRIPDVPNELCTASVFVKAQSAFVQFAKIDIVHRDGTAYLLGARTVIDLHSGAITYAGNEHSKVIAYPDGWYRIVCGGIPDAGVGELRLTLDGDEAAEKGYFVWGADFKVGGLSSYVKTETTTATRPAGYFDHWQISDYDSGWLDAWPIVYPFGALEWEDDNFWSRQYSDEERAGYTAGITHILPADRLTRYWRVDIADPLNPAGFVQLGRVFIGPAWQPENNMTRGAAIAWETGTEVQEAYSGAEFFDEKTPYRVARFSLDWMSESEGLSQAFDLMRRAGISKEVLFVYDPTDTVHAMRRQFLGRLRALSPIEFPYATVTRNAFEIKELL